MTKRSQPFISIITATYNAEKYLQNLCDSLRVQTYVDFEWIVMDGCSADHTIDILRTNRDMITYWKTETDKGIYHAWNKALTVCQGEWICFLGADDFLWDRDVLTRVNKFLHTLPQNISVAYGKSMLVNEAGQPIHLTGLPWKQVKHKFINQMSIPHPGAMHRRTLFLKHGQFNESFKIAGDYEFLLRELKTNDAQFMDEGIICGIRQGGASSRPDFILHSLMEVRKAQKLNGLHHIGFPYLIAFLRSFFRSCLWHILGERNARSLTDGLRKVLGLPAYWTKL